MSGAAITVRIDRTQFDPSLRYFGPISAEARSVSPILNGSDYSIIEMGNVCCKVEQVFRTSIEDIIKIKQGYKDSLVLDCMNDLRIARDVLIKNQNVAVQSFMQARCKDMKRDFVSFLEEKNENYKLDFAIALFEKTQSDKDQRYWQRTISRINYIIETIKSFDL